MKNCVFIFLIAVLATMGCKNPTEKQGVNSTPPPPPPPPPTATIDTAKELAPSIVGGSTFTCYQFVSKGKDVSSCQIETRATLNPFVSGYFDWAPYQKDGGHGVLKNGVIKDNMLTADFIYMIEGNVQAEEVYFKMEGDKLTEMKGELVEKKGKLVPKDKTKLKAGTVLVKVDCAKTKGAIDGIKSFEKELVMPKQ